MGDFFEGVNLKDLIGSGLEVYKQREQSKIAARLNATREQMAAYEEAARSNVTRVVSDVSDNKWQVVAGVAVVALLAYMVLK